MNNSHARINYSLTNSKIEIVKRGAEEEGAMLNLIEPFDLAFLSSLSTGRRMIFRFPFSIREKLFSPSREDFIFFSSFTSNRARVSSFNLKTKGRKEGFPLGKIGRGDCWATIVGPQISPWRRN